MIWNLPWRKKPAASDLAQHRVALNQMAAAVLTECGIDFDTASQLNQALVGTYLFGMISAYGMMHRLTPPQIHALALMVFMETLHYTDQAAAEGVGHCIQATSPAYHDTLNAILHRGIDGHAAYVRNDLAKAAENLKDIIAHFERKAASGSAGGNADSDRQ